MSKRLGAHRSVWRYDPIIIDDKHTLDWHIERFSETCKALRGCTERCFISFVDAYKSLGDKFRALTNDEMIAIATRFSPIAKEHGIEIFTCAEAVDLAEHGILKGACIEQALVERVVGHPITAKVDANQRTACCCIESVDIGAYDTCPHGCIYCYATSSEGAVSRRITAHNPHAPMLIGYPKGDEIITNRTTPSQKCNQLRFF